MTDYLLGTGAFVAVEPNTEAKAVVDSLTAQVSKFGDEVIATVTPPGICVSSPALVECTMRFISLIANAFERHFAHSFLTVVVRAYSWKWAIKDLHSSTDECQRWWCMQLGIASVFGWSLYS